MSGRPLSSHSPHKRLWVYLLCLFLLVYVLVYMPTPYVINAAGTADELKPIVTVAGGDSTEKGTFMLTTVSIRYANVALLINSLFDADQEIGPKPAQTDRQEYAAEQLYYMNSSQSNAIAAAYNKAGIAYTIKPQYVFVVNVPGDNTSIHAGDKFIQIDNQPVRSFEEMEQFMQKHKAGDIVNVVIERAGTELKQNVTLTQFQNSDGQTRVGFGVSIGEVRQIIPKDPENEVKFANTSIGGPSAGLMFTLEIYNQLTAGDLSKGYRIAGTGTIDPDGRIGMIGGVQHKVVAAQNNGAEIFLVPQGNYADAQAQLTKMGSSMKIIPVNTLDDALQALTNLPARS